MRQSVICKTKKLEDEAFILKWPESASLYVLNFNCGKSVEPALLMS